MAVLLLLNRHLKKAFRVRFQRPDFVNLQPGGLDQVIPMALGPLYGGIDRHDHEVRVRRKRTGSLDGYAELVDKDLRVSSFHSVAGVAEDNAAAVIIPIMQDTAEVVCARSCSL